MTAPTTTLTAAALLASGVWLWHLLQWLRHRRGLLRLIDQPDEPPPDGWPTLAALFAARDEARTVGPAARSLLAQDYPALRVVAVDDRSEDATGDILDELAEQDGRLRVIHITELPDGWLGKTYALQRAAGSAEADWLLFTDADVHFAPTALRRAVAFAERAGATHVTVAPVIPTEGFGERVFLAMFDAAFAIGFPAWRVEDLDRRTALGIGAFNLVRSGAFRDIGGFRRLALSVDDDMKLGEALKTAGGRPRVLMGDRAVTVKWHTGLRGMVRGLEKNFFAVARYRLSLALGSALLLAWVGAGPHVGLFVGPIWSRLVCAAGVAAAGAAIAAYGGKNGVRPYYALTLPISAAAMIVALTRSVCLTLARGGVVWRGHLYPLAALRDHVRRRERWLREVWLSTR